MTASDITKFKLIPESMRDAGVETEDAQYSPC
jgi:hypothetical protein